MILAAVALLACKHGPGGPVPFARLDGHAVATVESVPETGGTGDTGDGSDTATERIPVSIHWGAHVEDDVLVSEMGWCFAGPRYARVEVLSATDGTALLRRRAA